MSNGNCKKLGIAAAAAVAIRTGHQYFVHHVLLLGVYHRAHYQGLWNPPATMHARMPVMFLSHILYGIMFAWIYAKGYEADKAPLGQGLRFGALIGLLGISWPMMEYFVYPVSCKLAAAWAGTNFVEALILGVAIASIYQPGADSTYTH